MLRTQAIIAWHHVQSPARITCSLI
jgi:hypothetical protein